MFATQHTTRQLQFVENLISRFWLP